ncbi:hypothetical protein AB2B41_04695 [Marimonas sp. MJW-29]|uniref:Secreted protein n=1 Tax=Sulfitobacter sediminis TaxID=3234186 RepID=A0ABV3RJL7_9RHOB
MRIKPQLPAILALILSLSLPVSALAITGFENDPPNPPNDQDVTNEDPVTEDPPDEDVTDDDPVTEEPDGEDPTVVIIQNRDGPPEEKDFSKKDTDTKKPVKETKPYVPETKVYPVPTTANYCPPGLQPVTVSGTVSCGRPTERITYQQMMQTPQRVVKRKTYHRSARPDCRPGVKGCAEY